MIFLGMPDSKIKLLDIMFYVGEIMGCISIARLPDVYGRRWPFTVSLCAQFPCLIAAMLSRSFTFTTVISFIMGYLRIALYNGGYINVCEYVHGNWKNHVCTILLVFDMFTSILTGIYFHYISNYWLYFSMIGLIFNGIAIIGIFFIPESPEYLYSYYKFDECR
jgi:MFS family permease